MKMIKQNLWAFALGVLLTMVANINILMWQFWVILIPIVILVAWSQE